MSGRIACSFRTDLHFADVAVWVWVLVAAAAGASLALHPALRLHAVRPLGLHLPA